MSDAIDVDGVRYLSTAEAAERAALSADYIALFCRQGKVRAKQVGRNWFVDPSSLNFLLIEHAAHKERRGEQLSSQLRSVAARTSRVSDATAPLAALSRAVKPQLPITDSVDGSAANNVFQKIATATLALALMFGAATVTSASARAFADETIAHLSAIGNNLANLAAVATPVTSEHAKQNSSPATSVRTTAATSTRNLFKTSSATPIGSASNATSYRSTPQKHATSNNSQTIIERVFQRDPLASANFVTQNELNTQLLQLSNNLTRKFSIPTTPSVPQYVAAGGNTANPFAAASAINNLSNVTISNPTFSGVTTANIPEGSNLYYTDARVDALLGSSATTTFGNGINLSTGCFAVNGTCITGSGGGGASLSAANTWTALQQFNGAASSTLFSANGPTFFGATATSSFNSAGQLTLANLASAVLAVNGSGQLVATSTPTAASFNATSTTATSTFAGGVSAAALNITSTTATSTFANGIALSSGCITVNGTCLGGTSASSTLLSDNNTFSGNALFSASTTFAKVVNLTNASSSLNTLGTVWLPNIAAGSLLYANASGQVAAASATYPFQFSAGSFSLAFGTTTPNTFSQLQTLSGGASTTVASFSNGTATTTIAGNAISTFGAGISATDLSVSGNATSTFASAVKAPCFTNDGVTCINGTGGGGGITSITAGTGLTGGTITTSGTIALDLTHANNWTGLQQFTAGASSSQESIFQNAYFGATATSSFNSAGQLTLANLASAVLAVNGNGQVVATSSIGTNLLTGTLGVANGGTGSTTLTGILKGNGTGAIQTAVGGTDYEFPLTFSTGLNRTGNTITNTGVLAVGSGYATTSGTTISLSTTTQTFNGLTIAQTISSPNGSNLLFTPTVSGTLSNSGLAHSTIVLNGTTLTLGDSADTVTAASSTLLSDNNTFNGNDTFNNTITGSVSGNAGTATKLGTARAINGINFDGTAAITITAASSTLLGDSNIFSGADSFTNASSNFAGTWQTFSPSHFQTAGTYLTGLGNYATTTATAISISTSTLAFNGLTLGNTFAVAPSGITVTPTVSGTLNNSGLANSTISGVSLGGTLANLSAGNGLSGSAYNGSGTESFSLNLANANSWTGLQQFTAGASSSQESIFQNAYFGATATSSFNSAGQLTLASALAATSGGTGQSAVTTGDLLYGSGTNAWSRLGIGTGGYVLGVVNGVPAWVATTTLANISGILAAGSGGTGWTTINSGTVLLGNGSSALSTTTRGNLSETGSSILTITGGTNALLGGGATIQVAQASGSQNGYLASADWTTFNNKQAALTFSYPLVDTANTVSFAFGTTTSNTWTGTQTFGNLIATNSTTTSLYVTGIASHLLKTDSNGQLVAAVAGTDYQAAGNYLTSLGNYATTTGTAISLSTSTFSFNGLTLGQTAAVSANSILFTPTLTGTLANAGLLHSTIVLNGTTLTLGDSADTISAASSTALSDNNTWSGNALFSASTTFSKVVNLANASSTLNTFGTVWLPNIAAGSLLYANASGQVAAASATYPFQFSGGGLSLAFGTTTSNTFAGTQTFTNAPTFSSLSGLLQGNGSSVITAVSGTPGQFPYFNGSNTLLATSSLFLAAGGNVGIGTTSPFANLAVQTATNGNAFAIDSANSSTTFQVSTQNTANNILEVASSTGAAFFDITAAGNVGVGTTSPQSTFAVVGSGCFSEGGTATVACGTTAGTIYADTVTSGSAYDLAENYVTSDTGASPGTIVGLDPNNPEQITTATTSTNMLGVVSTKPGFTLGGADASTAGERVVPIALSGRVPVKISLANGPIDIGDRLALSTTIPGVAVKALDTGETIGIALEAGTTSSSLIDVFVQPEQWIAPQDYDALFTLSKYGAATSSPPTAGSFMDTFIQNLFAQVTQWLADASNGITDLFAENGHFSNELCVGSTCVTPAQFQAMVAAASAPQSSGQGSSGTSSDTAGTSQATDTPPMLQINGANPAIIQVGATYNDLGATITGPQADLNLGITTYVNGIQLSPVQIDTTQAATDTIDYVATDQSGLTSTSTRTVIVEPAAAPSIVPTDDASSTADNAGEAGTATSTDPTTTTASTTAATSTAQ